MRLQIYVPKAQAERWVDGEGVLSFNEFERRVVNLAGGITVTQATGFWNGTSTGYVQEPVLVIEALSGFNGERPGLVYENLWLLFRTYARQLIEQGEESVLIVQDNEPTLIT